MADKEVFVGFSKDELLAIQRALKSLIRYTLWG